jgi:hypothetical protein
MCAAHKLPINHKEQCHCLFFCIAHSTYTHWIAQACFRVNIDQTQVVVQDGTKSTFAKQRSKQVDVTGKEEKRVWTAMAGVSASSDVLPFQIIMKGATSVVLPSKNAPSMDEACLCGFVFSFNKRNYWSTFALMKEYVEKILIPYWLKKKVEHSVNPDHLCILQLNVWSVHCGAKFQVYMHVTWPWIILNYVPGGCTCIWQPCDVRIQHLFKLAIKQAQLGNVVEETLAHLKKHSNSVPLKPNISIGTLRSCSVCWLLVAQDAVLDPSAV